MADKNVNKIVDRLTNQDLHDFLMDKVFTPENAKKAAEEGFEPEKAYMFKKGEQVSFVDSAKKNYPQDDYEIVGFYKDGNVVDENTADPFNRSYGVRIRGKNSGKEYPITSNWLQRREK